MNKQYKKERTKLTALYFGVILFIVILFSAIVINTQNKQLDRVNEIRIFTPPMTFAQRDLYDNHEELEALIHEVKLQNLREIILLDLVILLAASFLSYYLSGKTLEPIIETLDKQRRFVSDASHELRTPLTNIKTEAEVMNRSKSTTIDEYKEFTKNVIEDVDHLSDLVNFLLETAKLEERALNVSKTEVDLVELAKSTTDKFSTTAEAKNVTIKFKSERKKMKVITDKLLFQRLLSIIIDNAIKYNKEDGKVNVEVFLNQNKEACVEIKDTGHGIPNDSLPKIFDKFYRVSEDRNEKGFGLGLSIAKRLAMEIGVDIEVESRVGKGTSFVLVVG